MEDKEITKERAERPEAGSTSVRLAGDIHGSIKRERNRLYEETGVEPGMVALVEEAWRFYLANRDRMASEKGSDKVTVEASVDPKGLPRLRELAAITGFKSISAFVGALIERELSNEPVDLGMLFPKEAELARFLVEQYRGGEYKDIADMCMRIMARAKAKKKADPPGT